MRKHGRRDAIHADIRDVFTAYRWRWLDLADVGDDAPDAIVCEPGTDRLVLVEVKSGPKAKLKPGQERFAARWPVTVIRSVDEAEQFAAGRSGADAARERR